MGAAIQCAAIRDSDDAADDEPGHALIEILPKPFGGSQRFVVAQPRPDTRGAQHAERLKALKALDTREIDIDELTGAVATA